MIDEFGSIDPDVFAGSLNDRLANLCVVLLTQIFLMDKLKSTLPDITHMTIGDKFMMIFIGSSLTPIFYMLGIFVEHSEDHSFERVKVM